MRPGQRIEVGFNVPASKSVFGQSNFLNTHTTYECQKGAIRITLSSGEIDNCSHSFMQVSCMFRSKLKRKDTTKYLKNGNKKKLPSFAKMATTCLKLHKTDRMIFQIQDHIVTNKYQAKPDDITHESTSYKP